MCMHARVCVCVCVCVCVYVCMYESVHYFKVIREKWAELNSV